MSKAKSIEELDSNFQVAGVDKGNVWFDCSALPLEGQGWPGETEKFCRLPDRAQASVPAPVWNLSRHSAGLRLRFITDAPQVSARWELLHESLAMAHMPANGVSGLDLYARANGLSGPWRWAAIGKAPQQTNELLIATDMEPIEREFQLYLPLYNGVTSLQVGVPEGHVLRTAPALQRKPVCFYGTSIVHGGCASRPGMSYPAQLTRHLDLPHINLGFSGNGRSEIELANLLAELDPCAYVLDPLPNMQPAEVEVRMAPFVRRLRESHPRTPILLVESISYQHGWMRADSKRRDHQSNAALRGVYEMLMTENCPALYYVPGHNLLGQDGEGTTDGVHPSDVGFMRMAQEIRPILEQALQQAS